MVTAANVNLGVNEAWLRQVRCIDALDLNVPSSQQHQAAPSEGSSHQGETAPAVIIYVGGGTTPLEQVNDTHLHGGLKKTYEEQLPQFVVAGNRTRLNQPGGMPLKSARLSDPGN